MSSSDRLEPLYEQVSAKNQQLQQAIVVGDDALVEALDRELDPLISAIFGHRAAGSSDMYLQFHFLTRMIREDADDRASVLRHVSVLSSLLDRYFGAQNRSVPSETAKQEFYLPFRGDLSDDEILSDTILNSLPEKVAVITRDYRYLFVNPALASLLHTSQMDVIGRSVLEFGFDAESRQALRAQLDRCFGGGNGRVSCQIAPSDGALIPATGRFSPMRDTYGNVTGAVVILTHCTCAAGDIAA